MKQEISKSPEETEIIARRFAQKLEAGDIVACTGELGAGKTLFIRAVCQELGVKESVTSPTYTLMHIYNGREKILHLDCYRIKSPFEAEMLGLCEYFNDTYISFIEWADKIMPVLPKSVIAVDLAHVPGKLTWRTITLSEL